MYTCHIYLVKCRTLGTTIDFKIMSITHCLWASSNGRFLIIVALIFRTKLIHTVAFNQVNTVFMLQTLKPCKLFPMKATKMVNKSFDYLKSKNCVSTCKPGFFMPDYDV